MSKKVVAKPQKSHEERVVNDWKWLWKWLFILGGATAGATFMMGEQDTSIINGLMIVGVLLGIFYFDSNDLVNVGLRFIIFKTVAVALDGFFEVGFYITSFLVGFSLFLGPIVLAMCVVYFVKKYILAKS